MLKRKKYIIIILVFFLFAYPITLVQAESSNQPIAMALLVDTSGSVEDTDPKRLREDAANIFIDLLNSDDYLSIITFNSDVDLVIPMDQLKNDGIRESYKELLSSNLDPKGNTDYKLAFEKAYEELMKIEDKNIRRVVVFLTDGSPYPENIGADKELMDKYMSDFWDSTIRKLRESQMPVYSIGFSQGIDTAVLDKIALETDGEARIYKNMQDLDENLIQILKSRETIESELLKTVTHKDKKVIPQIDSDFWLREEGYWIGEDLAISASLHLENNRLISNEQLKVDQFDLVLDYGNDDKIVVALYDDGKAEHLDIKSNDGFWTNKVSFTKGGEAEFILIASGLYNGEPFTSEKSLDRALICEAGNVIISTDKDQVSQKLGKDLKLSVNLENHSVFKETVVLALDEKIGELNINKIELEANSSEKVELTLNLNKNLSKGFHQFTLNFKPENNLTRISGNEIGFNLELVTVVESLRRTVKSNELLLIILSIILIGIPLLVYLMGLLLFLILVKPKRKVKGFLSYHEEDSPDQRTDINLKKMRKNRVEIAFDKNKEADYHIEGSRFKYSLIIRTKNSSEKKSFTQGWSALFRRRTAVETVIECTQPGIFEYKGDLTTAISLSSEEVFSSGGFTFTYTRRPSRFIKEGSGGQNILEGRI